MQTTMPTAPTRVVALDFLSLMLLAAAAGVAAGITLGGVALLFASQASRSAPADAQPGRVIEQRLAPPPAAAPAAPRDARERPLVPQAPVVDSRRSVA